MFIYMFLMSVFFFEKVNNISVPIVLFPRVVRSLVFCVMFCRSLLVIHKESTRFIVYNYTNFKVTNHFEIACIVI
jgi:hypothetical protein